MAKKTATLERATASVRKSFNLSNFKKKKGFSNASVKFKEQGWIPLSKAFQDITSLPGIPTGHITLLRGHSDTGKTTALIEAAVNAQKLGILPVFIITEMKWSWEHAKEMGLEVGIYCPQNPLCRKSTLFHRQLLSLQKAKTFQQL